MGFGWVSICRWYKWRAKALDNLLALSFLHHHVVLAGFVFGAGEQSVPSGLMESREKFKLLEVCL